jgi:hypothetical protein
LILRQIKLILRQIELILGQIKLICPKLNSEGRQKTVSGMQRP